MSANDIILDIQDLYKDYQLPRKNIFGKPSYVHAVQGITIQLERGLIYGLVGESGCGKTTLAKMIAGVEMPTRGGIRFDAEHLIKCDTTGRQRENSRRVQLILQDAYAALPPKRTVEQILNEPLEIHGIGNAAERRKKIEATLETVQLPLSVLSRYHHELSAGVTQKISITRALLLDVDLILADESISSLDPISRIEIMNLFLKLNARHNLTIVFIAHDISTVQFLCDKVIVMYLGVCVEYADNPEIFVNSMHPYTQALMNAVPTLEKGLTGEPLYVLEGEVPSPTEMLPGCNFYSRCTHPARDEQCRTSKPALAEKRSGHLVNCFQV